MTVVAVVQELLAVVGDEHDQGVVEESSPVELLEQAAEVLVDRGDLGVVDIAQVRDFEGLQLAHVLAQGAGGSVRREARPVRLRGVVGRVRIHRVHEHEERVFGTYPFQPLQRSR